MQTIAVIPTYNEIDNVGAIIDAVLAVDRGIDVMVVDDNSPDGTGGYVKQLMKKNRRVHLVENPKKGGIGPAYIRGFIEAIKLKPEYIVQIDADFSHDPAVIKEFLNAIKNNDLVIGSRYCDGISVIRWPMSRLLLSYSASVYIRFVLGMKVKDPTAGFKCFRRSALEKMNFARVRSTGYSYQIEMNYAFEKNRLRVREIPIVFVERRSGASKMSRNIIVEALLRVLRLRFQNAKAYFKK